MEKIEFWKDREKGLVDPVLLSTIAEKFAKVIAEDHAHSRKTNKRTQIRKFFDEVLRLKAEVDRLEKMEQEEDKEKKWNTIFALVNMLVAKTAYAKGRDLVSDNFLSFMRSSVSDIRNPADLKLFSLFFEAFMGFYRLHGPST